jgi:hypothetical protein
VGWQDYPAAGVLMMVKRSRLSKVKSKWKVSWTQEDYDGGDIRLSRDFPTEQEMVDFLQSKKHSARYIGKSIWDVKRAELDAGGKE